MKMSVRSGFSVVLLVGLVADCSSSGHDGDVAKAIVEIAKINGEVDVERVSHYLRLPNLQRDLAWMEPPCGAEACTFSGYYDPPDSVFGITKVSLQRQTGASVVLGGKPARLDTLRLFFKPGYCPRATALADALASKATEMLMPGYDGGPSYKTTTFFVPQAHGDAVQITFVGDSTCSLTISHSRPLKS
jgi:hypothetical protein